MKNHCIELVRFLLCIVIALWHFNGKEIMARGYLAVDFFFILSGWFMFTSWQHKHLPVLQYSLNKVKRFYPQYLIAMILTRMFTMARVYSDAGDITLLDDYIAGIIPELLFLQNVGLFRDCGANGPLWYMSVLVWGGGLVYVMLQTISWNKLKILFPLIAFFSYTLIINEGSFNIDWSKGIFSAFFWRGVSDMIIGCLVARWYQNNDSKLCISSRYSVYLQLGGVILFNILIFSSYIQDVYILLVSFMILIPCFRENTVLNKLCNKQLVLKMGQLSLSIYFIHSFCCGIMRNVYKLFGVLEHDIFDMIWMRVVYLIVVIVSAIALQKLSNLIITKR